MLCRILVQALSWPGNDLMQNPQVKNYVPEKFPQDRHTLSFWLDGASTPWPFGVGNLSNNKKNKVAQIERSSHKLGELVRSSKNFVLPVAEAVVEVAVVSTLDSMFGRSKSKASDAAPTIPEAYIK